MQKNKTQSNIADRARIFLSRLLLVLLAILFIYPLLFILLSSFKSNLDVLMNPFGISTFRPANYAAAWRIGKIGKYFLNSCLVTGVTLLVQMLVIVPASYAFAKIKPTGSKVIEFLYLAGLLVTSEMLIIPNFVTIKAIGLGGTRLSLILPYVTGGITIGVLLMTNYIRSLPKELDEASFLDGAGIMVNLVYVTLPLMKPIISTVLIFNLQSVWSEFYWALIEINNDALKTLPLGLMNFQSQYNSDFGVLCAGLMIATIPVILLYIRFSSFFISGLTAGAVKG